MSPLVILGLIAIGVYFFRKPLWRIVWHAVRFFLWRPKAFMLVIVAFLCWNTYGIWTAPDAPEQVPPPPAEEPATPVPSGQRTKFSPVSYPDELPSLPGKLKDGNSRFAADLLRKMGTGELQWYSRIFYHAIETLPVNNEQKWLFQMGKSRMFGRIHAGTVQKQGSGIICRDFVEVLAVGDEAQLIDGIACQRVGGGWCKLRPGSARTCEIKTPSGLDGFWYSAKRGLRQLF